MQPQHVLLCYFASGEGDRALRRVAALCEGSSSRLSVVLPVVDAPPAGGCCGIQHEQWQRLMDEDTREALEHATRLLQSVQCRPANVAMQAGSSLAEAVQRAAERWGCDVVAVGRKVRPWSGGLSRRRVKALRRRLGCEVVELGNSPGEHAPLRFAASTVRA